MQSPELALLSLPFDVLGKALHYLDLRSLLVLAQANRQFNYIVYNTSHLWYRLDLLLFRRSLRDEDFRALTDRVAAFVRNIDLTGCNMVTVKSIRRFIAKGRLEKLVIKGHCQLGDISSLASPACSRGGTLGLTQSVGGDQTFVCPTVRHVDFSHSSQPLIDEESLRWYAERFPNLRWLSVAHTPIGARVGGTLRQCVHLEWLDVSGTSVGEADDVEKLARGCPKLKGLVMSECVSVDDRGLEVLGRWAENLETLVIDGCRRVSNRGVLILGGCRQLRYLNIRNCRDVDPAALNQLSQVTALEKALGPLGKWRFWVKSGVPA
ncbi:hypothetical protein EV182_006001 [Spiromyces aspiralis]|uniref:Uncharacterized protein n=1 Tax=Spiromyces aspiralis TaxID=68401 RepID=A0ACC1HM14_9FUNG|nr:hypothetical protein EV182_006001 [Spiromyces aspiralis]